VLVACGLAVALLPAAGLPRAWPAVPVAWCVAAIVLGLDAAALALRARSRVRIDAPDALYVGETDELACRIDPGPRATTIRAAVDLSDNLAPQPAIACPLPAAGAEIRFPLAPLGRGRAGIERLWLAISSPLGLFRRTEVHEIGRECAVLPSLALVRGAAFRFFADRSFRSGLKIERYTGDGTEFESLKEFVDGDDRRAVDWKASARHRELVCRHFRAERNHQLVIALDTGRLMSERIAGVPKVDHAIHAALLLAYTGLASGDRVGLFTFDARIGTEIRPLSGRPSIATLIRALASADYSEDETNYTLGLTALGRYTRRRSLVVLLTDFVDTITAELMVENVERVARRHVVVFVSIRDPLLDGIEAAPPDSVHALHRAVVARSLSVDREVIHRRLERMGIHALDAEPGRIGSALVNRYLDIKRRELV
jgi:uncharacterized protein (DUF58 family)